MVASETVANETNGWRIGSPDVLRIGNAHGCRPPRWPRAAGASAPVPRLKLHAWTVGDEQDKAAWTLQAAQLSQQAEPIVRFVR